MGQGFSNSKQFLASLPEWAPKDKKFFHFYNVGNTCYCNSIIQTLISSKYVNDFFGKYTSVFSEESKIIGKTPLFQFNKIYLKTLDQENQDFVISLQDLLQSVRAESHRFRRGSQHDAQEFFIYIVDSFDSAIDKINKAHPDREPIPNFSKLFEIQKIQTFQCSECNYQQHINDTSVTFCVSVESGKPLDELISESFKTEILNGKDKWNCDQCKQDRDATITSKFKAIPDNFVVHLQRIVYNRNTHSFAKALNYVKIPLTIALEEQCLYELRSIVIHVGSHIQKGHYLAINHIYEADLWILANDLKLYVTTLYEMMNFFGEASAEKKGHPVPYLLFYERIYKNNNVQQQNATENTQQRNQVEANNNTEHQNINETNDNNQQNTSEENNNTEQQNINETNDNNQQNTSEENNNTEQQNINETNDNNQQQSTVEENNTEQQNEDAPQQVETTNSTEQQETTVESDNEQKQNNVETNDNIEINNQTEQQNAIETNDNEHSNNCSDEIQEETKNDETQKIKENEPHPNVSDNENDESQAN
ncbi:Clan CA, family C19, ubiquitin hydrolase-like cysteine peptidase [Histomonas meleagridis]|uniref:Clan CA, family C19, ubiquitin hydrolase-like cysteine peptidase n=1 Tax=Histomonas meleagridis TaxID=135588 RepID=UPI003559AD06|nr:Clan CA, family C19, ubiquitin hydrolase-like cysteine peptidase [Histomonas meleagridis]KAH0801800.1 Clan CA, family C19, ubiquitin hydrolase-like cysteine peptidase [Histomonas meleagridis]